MAETKVIVNAPMKSEGVSIVLTILFGGLGLLYSTIKGGIIMTIVEIINLFLCCIIIGFFLWPVIHIIAVIWGLKAVRASNLEMMEKYSS